MAHEFVLYQKFTDIDSAEYIAKKLKESGIDYKLQDVNHAYLKVVGYNSIDIAIGLHIKQTDFLKADDILENYYDSQIEQIDKSYYLFKFTTEELKEIISSPYEWGRLDYQLAKYLLKERGLEVSREEINALKNSKIVELSTTEKESNFKIIIGYILAFAFPFFAIFIGLSIKYNRKILPNGDKFYINTNQDRKHAARIIMISVVCICLCIIYMVSNNYYYW